MQEIYLYKILHRRSMYRMKVMQIVEIIDEESKVKIDIKSINSSTCPLINDISTEGYLKYENFMVKYIDPQGNGHNITDSTKIDHIEYKVNDYKNTNFNYGGDGEVVVVNIAPQPPIYNAHVQYERPIYYEDNGMISESYIKDGVIYPGESINGKYVYSSEYGEMYRKESSKYGGTYLRTSEYPEFLGEGYVTIEDGILNMVIDVPVDGKYNIYGLVSNHHSNSTINKVMVNDIARYIRSSANMQFLWQESPLEQFNFVNGSYEQLEEIPLKKGPNEIKFIYDENFSTKYNDIDGIVLDHIAEYDTIKEIYDKYDTGKTYLSKTIYSLDNAYVDNSNQEGDSGFRRRSINIGNSSYTAEELDFYSNKIIELTGTIKTKLKVPNEDYYKFYLTGTRDYTKEDSEDLIITINNEHYIGRVKRDECMNSLITLYEYHTSSGIYEEIEYVKLEKSNIVTIRSTNDRSNIYLDTIVIDKNFRKYRSDIFHSHELLPNIDEFYFISKSYHHTNEKIKSLKANTRYFNSNKEYLDKGLIYTVNNLDFNKSTPDHKLDYTIRYKTPNGEQDVTVNMNEYFDPKILMINQDMSIDEDNNGLYFTFKPFILKSFSYDYDDTM